MHRPGKPISPTNQQAEQIEALREEALALKRAQAQQGSELRQQSTALAEILRLLRQLTGQDTER